VRSSAAKQVATGADKVLARAFFDPDNRALLGLRAGHCCCRERQYWIVENAHFYKCVNAKLDRAKRERTCNNNLQFVASFLM
jgi:hypothetical protein